MRPSELRGILAYTSRFRGKLFVLSLDSEVLLDENFRNIMVDISVLRSLGIAVLIVHGAGKMAEQLAQLEGVELSTRTGSGVTDRRTLEISMGAAARLSQSLLEGLSEVNLRGAVINAITAHPSGIVSGQDQEWTGRVERVDSPFLQALLEKDIVPILSPIGFDGEGNAYRVNSDGVSLAVAMALKASKLIFISNTPGVQGTGSLAAQFSILEAGQFLKRKKMEIDPDVATKLAYCLEACSSGVNRAHIIDGTSEEALLSEVFSNEGVGTMVHANEYESIRRARKKDVRTIARMTRKSVDAEEVLPRSEKEIGEKIGHYSVFDIDGNVVGCVMVAPLDKEKDIIELGNLFVATGHENQGIGQRLMSFATERARELGGRQLVALSTRAFNYFRQKGGFEEGSIELLPPERRQQYEASGRHSKILVKNLN